MAPPVVVVDKSLVKIPENCPLATVVQFECGIYDSEVVCTPFKRLFRVCNEKGRKLPRSYEVTDYLGPSRNSGNRSSQDIKKITQEVLSLR